MQNSIWVNFFCKCIEKVSGMSNGELQTLCKGVAGIFSEPKTFSDSKKKLRLWEGFIKKKKKN